MSNDSQNLRAYRRLILASLAAQQRDDIERENAIIDELDVIWAEMTKAEHDATEQINAELTTWFYSMRGNIVSCITGDIEVVEASAAFRDALHHAFIDVEYPVCNPGYAGLVEADTWVSNTATLAPAASQSLLAA